MLAALSAASIKGLWLLCDDQATEIIAEIWWTDPDSRGLSTQMAPHFETLLQSAKVSRDALTGLFGVSGPGAFTGLRMSSAFLQGLARALKIPLKSIPTFDLVGQPFFVPLRHQKAKNLDLSEALASDLEFLKIENEEKFSIERPTPKSKLVGLKDIPLWPSSEALLNAVRKNLASERRFEISYGLEPKISGVRDQKKDR